MSSARTCGLCGQTQFSSPLTPNTATAALKFKRCGQCKAVWYCSAECQQKHWSTHKADCKPAPSTGTSASAALASLSLSTADPPSSDSQVAAATAASAKTKPSAIVQRCCG